MEERKEGKKAGRGKKEEKEWTKRGDLVSDFKFRQTLKKHLPFLYVNKYWLLSYIVEF